MRSPAAALAVFALTYLFVAAPGAARLVGLRLSRPAAAFVGAVAMVAVGGLPLADAYAAVDLDVLAFLLGVLVLVGYLEAAGAFEWAAAHVVARARRPAALLAALVWGSGLAAALLMNDTVCLLLTPLVLAALRPLGWRPAPFLLAVALASNVGSAMTAAGNPQNMLVALSSRIGFGRFALALAPAALGGLALVHAALHIAYRRDLAAGAGPPYELPNDPPNERLGAADFRPALDRPLALAAAAVFALVLVGWLAGRSLPLVALVGAAALVLVARRDPAPVLARVDWPLLLFFAALSVVTRGVQDLPLVAGATHAAAAALRGGAPAGGGTAGAALHDAWVTSAAMLGLSNLVSNVPAVLLWRPVVRALPHPTFVWLVTAMSATFAGNLTLVGSMANLIVAERAAARGARLGFAEYLRVGVPITLLTTAWGVLTLVALRRFAEV